MHRPTRRDAAGAAPRIRVKVRPLRRTSARLDNVPRLDVSFAVMCRGVGLRPEAPPASPESCHHLRVVKMHSWRERVSCSSAPALQQQKNFHHVYTRMVKSSWSRAAPCPRTSKRESVWARNPWTCRMGKVAPFGQIATYPKMPGTRKTFECPAPFGSLQRLGAALEGVLVLVTFCGSQNVVSHRHS